MKTIIALLSIIFALASTSFAQNRTYSTKTSSTSTIQTNSSRQVASRSSETVSQRIDLRPGAVNTINFRHHSGSIQVRPQKAKTVHLDIKTNGDEVPLEQERRIGSKTTYKDRSGRWTASTMITPTPSQTGGDPHYGWIEIIVGYDPGTNSSRTDDKHKDWIVIESL